MSLYPEPLLRAEEYLNRRNLSMERQIGGGTQGVVLATNMGTAIKALIRKEHYLKERDVYLRLQEYGIGQLAGFNVPELISYHDELLIIEMQIVVNHTFLILQVRTSTANHPTNMISRSWTSGSDQSGKSSKIAGLKY